jgi:large subunit ribosomal protein L29
MKKAITEIRGDDSAELKAKLNDLRKEQFELRFRGTSEETRNTARHREVRRTIARILMVLGERERAAAATTEQKR